MTKDDAERDVVCWYLARREADPRASIVRPVHLQSHAVVWQAALDGAPSHVAMDVPGLTAERVAEAERSIVSRWARRHAARALASAVASLADGGEPGSIAADIAKALAEAASGGLVQSVTHRDAAGAALEQWIRTMADSPRVIPAPWKALQAHTGGIPLGKLIVLGGRSSEHKTTTARELAESTARWCSSRAEGHALYWTMEDCTIDLAGRTIADNVPKLTTRDMLTGTFRGHLPTADDLATIGEQALAHRSEDWTARLRYLDEANPTLSRVLSVISAEAARGCKQIVLDFFHLIRPDKGPMSPDAARQIATALHGIAKTLNVSILALGQLDKAATIESAQEKRVPVAAEMLFGSMLKQTAFGVIMVALRGHGPKAELDVLIEKWKASDPNVLIRLRVDPAHDRLLDP